MPRAGRRMPIGAELVAPGRVHVRVWAPAASTLTCVVDEQASTPLVREADGYWSAEFEGQAGTRYGFRVDDDSLLLPDPASRYQPEGPHRSSQVVDPATFEWHDASWDGVSLPGQVLYEMHVGTFTPDGTWQAAARELEELNELGITVIEVMPVAEFDGAFGWGYDGVDLFAPYHRYGTPDDLRDFVDRAHQLQLAVILDVVYNHFGPSGNYLRRFSSSYFSEQYDNEWGDAINFDGLDAGPVRELFVANAAYWIDEFHMDGLRLDATQQIYDASARHVIAECGRAVRQAARGRRTIVVAENEPQHARLVRPEPQGLGLDGLWNDDFHHSAMVALTARSEAYYSDTRGTAQEFVAAAKYGYLFQGQRYSWQRKARGTPALDLQPWQFVLFLQNHDQVANSVHGLRLDRLTSPARVRAMTALLLLMPGTPMLFQGQEYGASQPFLYFADHEPALAAAVLRGRAEFLTQFPSAKAFEQVSSLDDPAARTTLERCILQPNDRRAHGPAWRLHRDLLRLRRETRACSLQQRGGVDGFVLSDQAWGLRFFAGGEDDRLLLVNLGRDLALPSIADPLAAPPEGCDWRVEWSSEHPAYDGAGVRALSPERRWTLSGESAVVLRPVERREPRESAVTRRTA